ncbi:MAG TPA: methyltransferase domain-containing protein [Acidimicrobiia bacterium]|nr:methyltransferase domain-containing protein [Acidimicrobiia bacterium]
MRDVTFRCPHCHEPLLDDDAGVVCAQGHRFDRAREGYLHLVPSGRHRSRPAGDDEQMVHARRAFFDRGHYRPLMDAVASLVADARPAHVLDAGCGEGSYLAAVTSVCDAAGWGIDVSKPAIRLAARRHPEHRYAVASSFVLPFADAALDVVTSVFAPRHFPELFRVLRARGVAVVAAPGPDHLAGVRALVYDDPRPHDERAHVSGDGEPAPVRRERVRFELDLDDPADVLHLLQMTPYWWHARPEQQAAAAARSLRTTVDVWLTVHARP